VNATFAAEPTLSELTCDVVIVGLGPTGSGLANILGAYGWSVVGLERDEDLYYSPRAVHFDDETMRIFQSMELDEEIAPTSEPFTEMQFISKARGRTLLNMKVGYQDRRYGHAGAWWFHQPTLERHIRDGMKRFSNVREICGATVSTVTQESDWATVVATMTDGKELRVRARFVIGCDGGRSVIRKAAGLTLESLEFEQPWVVVDTKTRTGAKDPQLPRCHQQTCNPKQPVTYVPLAGPYYEFQFMVPKDKTEREATDPEHVRRQLREYVDLNTIDIIRIAYYTFHAVWAPSWRNGRILLAGDSAHQMPPFLGQGMCSGLRDAHALGWRLDLVLSGKASTRIFDDYEAERRDHVVKLIKGAMFLGSVIQTRNRLVAFLRDVLMFKTSRNIKAAEEAFYGTAVRKEPLSLGFLGTNRRKLAGTLGFQPSVVNARGERCLLDSVGGPDFYVAARAGTLDGNHRDLEALQQAVPCRLVEFGPSASGAIVSDADGELTKWFDAADIDFAIVRPDRYVFDGGRAADFASVTNRLRSLIGASQARIPVGVG